VKVDPPSNSNSAIINLEKQDEMNHLINSQRSKQLEDIPVENNAPGKS
jgi:hypothetical protein